MNTRATGAVRVVAGGLMCLVGLVLRAAVPAGSGEHHPSHEARDKAGDQATDHGPFHLEIDNSQLTVVRVNIPPHGRVPEHDVTPRVIIWLTEAHLKMTFPDGTSREELHHAGETGWVMATRHTGENLGDQPIEFVAVIPKATTAASRSSAGSPRRHESHQ